MKDRIEDLMKRTFIRLRSDYGFKRSFSSPENALVLKNFLNSLFEGKMVITEVKFQDKEILPPDPKGKKIFYDVYCTTSTGRHFIVEMQRKPSDEFGKRMVLYISACVYRQGAQGRSYAFKPVFLIAITDFDHKRLEKRLVNEVVLMEKNTHIVFTDDFKMYFLSLAQVPSEWDECKTDLERRLFIIKNMEDLNKNSKPYLSGEYEEMFNAAEISSMAADEMSAYKNSILWEEEREAELDYAKREAREAALEEGREEGRAEGRAEGREEEKLAIARQMKQNGLSSGDIMLYTGLSESQIQNL